jgi:hypothetical protein
MSADTLNNFVTAGTQVLGDLITNANSLADKLVAAGSKDLLLHQFRDEAETDDANILKYRKWYNSVNEEILKNQAAVEKYIIEKGFVSQEPIDVEKITAQYKDLVSQARDMRKTLLSFPGVEKALEDVPEIKAAPGTGRGGASSAGIPRPRFAKIEYRVAGSEAWIDVFTVKDAGKPEEKRVTNLTVLAQLISKDAGKDVNVSAKDLQGPLYETAGTQDLSTIVEFGFTAGEKNYEVRVSPKN